MDKRLTVWCVASHLFPCFQHSLTAYTGGWGPRVQSFVEWASPGSKLPVFNQWSGYGLPATLCSGSHWLPWVFTHLILHRVPDASGPELPRGHSREELAHTLLLLVRVWLPAFAEKLLPIHTHSCFQTFIAIVFLPFLLILVVWPCKLFPLLSF